MAQILLAHLVPADDETLRPVVFSHDSSNSSDAVIGNKDAHKTNDIEAGASGADVE